VEQRRHTAVDPGWRVALFEVGRPPIVLETSYPLRSLAWLAALPLRLRDALNAGVSWRPVRVPGYSTVRPDAFARWHRVLTDR
jgi:hypothetical protein